ncbi:MAG: 50S ribosomal protein L4 [Candidatus Shikimatogenerans sp. Ttur]|uniref:Large ribosomal subunit protein uL4 n=1 Tax=Candidatus Shikimatogenerans sp. Ttur TaxID=3158569 RepID=A0AAU7ZXY7_9FLAO
MYIEILNFKKNNIDNNIFNIKNIIFKKSVKNNKNLFYFYFRNYFFLKRQGNASTKNRSQIKGSNRKICQQKGMGVARKGNIKNPLFRGGGVIFGPKKKKYKIKINKKIIKKCYQMIFRKKIINNFIKIIINFKKKININKFNNFLYDNFFNINEKILIILSKKCNIFFLNFKNFKNIKVILINNINIYLLKKFKYIFFDIKLIINLFNYLKC